LSNNVGNGYELEKMKNDAQSKKPSQNQINKEEELNFLMESNEKLQIQNRAFSDRITHLQEDKKNWKKTKKN